MNFDDITTVLAAFISTMPMVADDDVDSEYIIGAIAKKCKLMEELNK